MTILNCGTQRLDLRIPQVMGVLNVTPDSFSDGGQLYSQGKPLLDQIYAQAESMVEAGAAILDVGGESTRPGARLVSIQEEMDRVLPVIERLQSLPVVLSLDTSKPELMRAGIQQGVGLINDIRALSADGALAVMAQNHQVAICLMHMQGQPQTMQDAPQYDDVIDQVVGFLQQRVDACVAKGISKKRLIVDPGFGFGKTLAHNLQLLKHLRVLQRLDVPVLVGLSRKSMLGQIVTGEPRQRLAASLAAALIAVQHGAAIVRVHDVQETIDVMNVYKAIQDVE